VSNQDKTPRGWVGNKQTCKKKGTAKRASLKIWNDGLTMITSLAGASGLSYCDTRAKLQTSNEGYINGELGLWA